MSDRDSAYQLGAHPPTNQNQMLYARAVAIQSYASLEFSLCTVFGSLLGVSTDLASIVFFRIINSGSRNRILDDLRKKKLGDQYLKYWDDLMTMVRALDQRRNEIVHWHLVQTINLDLPHSEAATLHLRPPATWMGRSSDTSLSEKEMNEFSEKCSFVSRSLNLFGLITLSDVVPPDEQKPWREIFQQQAVYPPPEGHPLSQSPKGPLPPIRPSEW